MIDADKTTLNKKENCIQRQYGLLRHINEYFIPVGKLLNFQSTVVKLCPTNSNFNSGASSPVFIPFLASPSSPLNLYLQIEIKRMYTKILRGSTTIKIICSCNKIHKETIEKAAFVGHIR